MYVHAKNHRFCCVPIALTLNVIALATASTTFGQTGYHGPHDSPPLVNQPVPSWPVEMGFSYHHASTAWEGAQRGHAQVLQAQANYLLNASQAAILREQAKSLTLENRERWIEYRTSLKAWKEAEREQRIAETRTRNLVKRAQRESATHVARNPTDIREQISN